MMNAQEIIAYIGAAEKKTPVKVYVNENAPVDYGSAKVFGQGSSKVVFGDWRELGPILAENAEKIKDIEIENDRRIAQLRRRRIKRQWWRFESAGDFERRVAELRREKAILRRSYRYEARLIGQEIDALARRQEQERLRQKKLEKSYEDFAKLLTFVESVESDAFWRSEVVQIVARTTPAGALEIDLVPRSGRHTVRFGRLEDAERKFDKLMRFYRGGLSRIGWEEFRTIDLRYNDQVVCRK